MCGYFGNKIQYEMESPTTHTPSKKKRPHKDRTLREKIEVLNKLKAGVRQVDLCKQYDLKPSTLSTWKKQFTAHVEV